MQTAIGIAKAAYKHGADWTEKRIEEYAAARVEAENDRLRVYEHEFRELMAIMHGDGGHYHEKHGAVKSREDAQEKWYALKEQLDRCTHCPMCGSDAEATLDAAKE